MDEQGALYSGLLLEKPMFRSRHLSTVTMMILLLTLIAATRPVATEEQLSADFRKKLAEWQRIKGERQPPPAPARKDLSEDFLKKWGKD